jgi:molybdenum cofactor cytidylyltransferase
VFSPLALTHALRLPTVGCPVVSLVGGGGKSTALFRLGAELAESGRRVLLTTTTRLFAAQLRQAPAHLWLEQLEALPTLLETTRQVLLTGPSDGQGKVWGVDPTIIDTLAASGHVNAIIIEADGSRMRPFKAPGAHEPVVPASTTQLVPVVGADVLGQSLTAENVHRPEQVASLLGVPLGSTLTPALVAAAVAHTEGGCKARPSGARLVPLINKAELDPPAAVALAGELLAYPTIDEVIVATLHGPPATPPSLVVYGRTAGVILAAGQATRFGATKQLQRWGETTLVGQVAQVALAAGLAPVLVVVGHEAEQVVGTLAHLPVTVVHNPAYAAGQATSVRAAAEALLALRPPQPNAALFLMADQPLITPAILETIRHTHRQSLAPIVVPTHEGQRGNPVLFDQALWPELLALTGDTGGRALFQAHQDEVVLVEVDSSAVLQDIDTQEAYEAMRGKGQAGPQA